MSESILWAVLAPIAFFVGTWWSGRRSAARQKQSSALWTATLTALAKHDFGGARALAATGSGLVEGLRPNVEELHRAIFALETSQQDHRVSERARHDLEDALASLPDGVMVCDAEARLRFVNRATAQLFGARVEDMLGAALLEALPSFELDQAVRRALLDGATTVREVAFYMSGRHQNGTGEESRAHDFHEGRREILLRVSPVRRPDGSASGAVAIMQDLTELRRLERVRRDFVANASHELRTPVANIRAAAETVLSDPDDPELRARFLPHLVTEAERLSRLISDLLDLARADADVHTEPRRNRVDVNQLVRSVSERLKTKAETHGIEVTCGACSQPAWVQGDAAELEQVAFNLLDNALSYTPSGGHVELRVSDGDHQNVTLAVEDSGIGIPPDDLPRVFERFYRVDKARSRSQGGTGLGLAIVKHIVENHGGHVAVESEVGRGTTFTVSLPGA